MGTHWEQGEKTKNNSPALHPTPKMKKQGPS